jgi:FAD binding domain
MQLKSWKSILRARQSCQKAVAQAAPVGFEPGGNAMVDATVPTGLIVAHELLRRGINCRPVDKRPAPQSSTRAFTVHARTMEMFDRMGIAHRVEEVRAVRPGNLFHFKADRFPGRRRRACQGTCDSIGWPSGRWPKRVRSKAGFSFDGRRSCFCRFVCKMERL